MAHIYRMYKFTKLVDKSNEDNVRKVLLEVQLGKIKAGELPDLFVLKNKACVEFSSKRVFGERVGMNKAAQTCRACLNKKYEFLDERKGENGDTLLILTEEKGLPFIDGRIPFIKLGLWKALYEEHGWIFAIVPGSVILTGIYLLIKYGITHSW